jgi:hypothetical protein
MTTPQQFGAVAAGLAMVLVTLVLATPAQAQWVAKSIDTMKESMDASDRGLTQAHIDQHIDQLAALHPTFITVDTPMDRVDVYRKWVQSIRRYPIHVWHRPADWGYPSKPAHLDPNVTPQIYLDHVAAFIKQNPDLFRSGDIFDGDSESDANAYWHRYPADQWFNDANRNGLSPACSEWNQYLVDLKTTADNAFHENGISGIDAGARSLNPFWAARYDPAGGVWYPTLCLADSTIASLGWLTLDAYFGDDRTDPAYLARVVSSTLDGYHQARPAARILLGEYGYTNSCALHDDATQAAVLNAVLPVFGAKPYIYGLNYWVGAGGPGYGGCTNILRHSTDGWAPRPGAFELANFFQAQP